MLIDGKALIFRSSSQDKVTCIKIMKHCNDRKRGHAEYKCISKCSSRQEWGKGWGSDTRNLPLLPTKQRLQQEDQEIAGCMRSQKVAATAETMHAR